VCRERDFVGGVLEKMIARNAEFLLCFFLNDFHFHSSSSSLNHQQQHQPTTITT
jgi:hypothetical protein